MQKKIHKVNHDSAESLMSFFVFLALIFSLYRAYTYSLFFVYWRVSFTLFTFSIAHSLVIGNITYQYLACLTIPVVMAFNTWLTHRTYKTDTGSQRQPHIKFCTTVGGMF